MPGKSAKLRAALDAQAKPILQLFAKAGYDYIVPDILQPADIFLDRSGEDIRTRTFVFTDPSGEELCLRPDLTVPTCRYHLEHGAVGKGVTRYCYSGPAFRFQPDGHDELRPREFDQVGLEIYGAGDAELAEAEIIALTIEAVRGAGLEHFQVKIGDLGLFNRLLDSVDMPDRWRRRLRHHFWRPQTFHETLRRLTGDPAASLELELEFMGGWISDRPDEVAATLEHLLALRAIPLAGGRTIGEIAERVADKAADQNTPPLTERSARLIQDYIEVAGRPRDALHRIMNLIVAAQLDLSTSLAAFARRITLMQERGVGVETCRFLSEFGRSLEYYTGFVFQIECETPSGAMPIAGGGRYDTLLSDIGAEHPVPAVGCAIHTERLLAAVRGEF